MISLLCLFYKPDAKYVGCIPVDWSCRMLFNDEIVHKCNNNPEFITNGQSIIQIQINNNESVLILI